MIRKSLTFVIAFLILSIVSPGCIKSISEDTQGKIIFQEFDSNKQCTIWEIDINGKDQKLITKISPCTTWNISPDGKKSICTITKSEHNKIEESKFILQDIETGKETVLTESYVDIFPSFSPDSKKIAFSSNRDGEDYEIYIMDIDRKGIIRLTDNTLDDYEPCWSPDGRKIIFTSEIPSIYKRPIKVGDSEYEKSLKNADEVYVIDVDTKTLLRLTDNCVSERSPIWSPDGKKIGFISDGELYVMDADSKNLLSLTEDKQDIFRDKYEYYLVRLLCFSPDSQKIAFTLTTSLLHNPQPHHIYVIDIDGRNLRHLISSPNRIDTLAWLPASPLDK